MSIGLVFKKEDKLFLTKYLGDGEFSDGYLISNEKPYEKLKEDQLSFTQVKEAHRENGNIAFILKDLYFITVFNKEKNDVKGYDILLDTETRGKLAEILEKEAEERKIEI